METAAHARRISPLHAVILRLLLLDGLTAVHRHGRMLIGHPTADAFHNATELVAP